MIRLEELKKSPEEIRESLEYRIAEFDPVRLYHNGNKGGKAIIVLEENEGGNYVLSMYAHHLTSICETKEKVKTHNDIVCIYNIENPILGGQEMWFDDKKLVIESFSTYFGGIPRKIMDNFVPVIKEYLKKFDYEKSERAMQEERYQHNIQYWEKESEKLKKQQEIVKKQIKERESQIKELSGFWNKWQAKKKKMSVAEYVAEKYASELIKPDEMPEIPPKPEFIFKPSSLNADGIEIHIKYNFMPSQTVRTYVNEMSYVTSLSKWKQIGLKI